ncbi:MAG TPA: A/G-specific adenine glycosylase [Thermoanaerobaculia bacterium]|nr:A/G-specific adenine glycosylase [Thermoanaerobaculia bacterium]
MQATDPRPLARRIETWFRRHQRPLPWRDGYDPYRVWVSEVMLQQTRMEVVLPYFERFTARFPTLAALAAASENDVLAAWSGLGYYRRAKMLRMGAIEAMQRFGGRVPDSVDELLTLPGIGRYTAGAIASVARNARASIVDGNVARVVSRLFAIAEPVASPALMREAWIRAEQLVNACAAPRDLNQGLMEIGALICTPRNPSCLLCPVRAQCATRGDALPLAKEKPPTRQLRIPLYLITDRRGRVLMRRERGPLMNAMLHLPHGNTSLFPGQPLDVVTGDLLGTFRHTVTTRRIEFALYAAQSPGRVGREYVWVDPGAIAEVPHPSYVGKALRMWGRRKRDE